MKKGKLFAKIALFTVCTLPLTGCDASALSEEIASIQKKLIPSWTSFVVQIAALAILVLIVVFCAYKPVKNMLKKRQDYIENNIRESEKSKALAQTREKQSSELILESKKQAALIIEEAQISASKEKAKIIASTKEEVQKMKQDAEKDIEISKQEALDDIHSEMVNVALAASSEILKREVNEIDNARLAEEFIENLK
ncbi:MAG: F0F1 ATP synthase subunit B [Bacilli bacterium]|nr:F0F1 ATP synthase subunit B [Bacilli bacterium]